MAKVKTSMMAVASATTNVAPLYNMLLPGK